MIAAVVTLFLAALPMAGASLDREAIFRQAGCSSPGLVTITQDAAAEWTVIVRCPGIPTADILRSDRWEAAHPAFKPCPLGACAGL